MKFYLELFVFACC